MSNTTRQEHLDWAKQRALAYLDKEHDALNAFTSMVSDLDKHPETAGHKGSEIGLQLLMIGGLSSESEMRRFIEGYN